MQGRPRKARIRKKRASIRAIHCSICGLTGHTRRRCRKEPPPIIIKAPKTIKSLFTYDNRLMVLRPTRIRQSIGPMSLYYKYTDSEPRFKKTCLKAHFDFLMATLEVRPKTRLCSYAANPHTMLTTIQVKSGNSSGICRLRT